ncbi:MAG: phage GP46 family protein [Candidatus Nanopelagicaceae bacterium]
MADVGLIWQDGWADILLNESNSDLQTGKDLKTAILVSLFSDSRANPEELLLDEDPRGWWSRDLGSLLWLLARQKTTLQNLEKGIQYIKDALNWLIVQNIAKSIDVTGTIENRSKFNFIITIKKSNDYRFQYLWENINADSYKFDRSEYLILFQ